MSTSSSDATRFFSMTVTKIDENSERKLQQCDLNQLHLRSASFSENNSRHGDGGGADRLVSNAVLDKMSI